MYSKFITFIIFLLFNATSSEAQIRVTYVLSPVGNDVEESSRIDFGIDLEGRRITMNNVRTDCHESPGLV
jgi:hypothetical protein